MEEGNVAGIGLPHIADPQFQLEACARLQRVYVGLEAVYNHERAGCGTGRGGSGGSCSSGLLDGDGEGKGLRIGVTGIVRIADIGGKGCAVLPGALGRDAEGMRDVGDIWVFAGAGGDAGMGPNAAVKGLEIGAGEGEHNVVRWGITVI